METTDTKPQWRAAMDAANEVRSQHKAIRQELRNGTRSAGLRLIAEALSDDTHSAIHTMRADSLLRSVRQIGDVESRAIFRAADVDGGKRIIDLTPGQRLRLVSALLARAGRGKDAA